MTKSGMKGARLGLAMLGMGTLLAASPAGAQATGNPALDGPGAALSHNLRSLAENPKSLHALMGAGKAAIELGDPQAAITFFGRAEEQAPRDGRIKMWIGAALVHLHKPDAAFKFFQEAVTLGVPEGEVARERGLAFDISGDARRAQRDYRLALQRGRDDEATRRLALSLAISGDREPALQLLEPQLLAGDRDGERTRALVLALTGDTGGAVRTVEASMPGGRGSALAPFLERLSALAPADRALAVHLGHFPQSGRNLPSQRTDTYASVEPAVRAGVVDPTQTALGRRRPGNQPVAPAATPPQQPAARQTAPATAVASARPAGGSRPTQVAARQSAPAPGADAARRTPSATTTPAPAVSQQTASASSGSSAARQSQDRPASSTPNRSSAWVWSGRGIEPRPSRQAPSETRIASAAPQVTEPAREQVASAQALRSSSPLQQAVAPQAAVPTPTSQQAAPTPQPAAPTSQAAALTAQPSLPPPVPATQPAVSPIVAEPAPTPAPLDQRPVQIADAGPAADAALQSPGFSLVGTTTAAAAASSAPADPAPEAPASSSRLADVAALVASLPEVVQPEPAAATPAPSVTAAPKPKAAAPTPPKKLAANTAKAAAPKETVAAAKKPPVKKAEPAEPARHWVQVAGGADKGALPREFARLKAKAPKLFATRSAWTTPLRATNRLLVGPFKSEGEAQGFVNELRKSDLSAFAWTSETGQKIEKLAAR
jgi:Flp pilus assembly protein TadD